MSISAFDEIYATYSVTGILRARPLGALAASMIGGAAIIILGASSFFVKPRSTELADMSAPFEAPAPAVPKAPEPTAAQSPAIPPKLFAAFDIAAPDFAKEEKTFSARRRDQGGRDDIVAIGAFSGRGKFLRLTVQQLVGEKLGNSDFFLDMNRHASQAGLSVVRIGPPNPLPSRFGAFEAADIRLIPNAAEPQPATGASERSCLAVRLINSSLSLEIAGIACGAGAKPMDRGAMSCILNRLDYLAPGENKGLDEFFVKAEADDQTQSCLSAAAPANAPIPPPRPDRQASKRSTQAR
jgi:hypothetical protein